MTAKKGTVPKAKAEKPVDKDPRVKITETEEKSYVLLLAHEKMRQITDSGAEILASLRAKYPTFDEETLKLKVDAYIQQFDANAKHVAVIEEINASAEKPDKKLPPVFMSRCDDCPGDPSCWDFVRNPMTGQHYKADMCIIRRSKPGGDLYQGKE